MVLTPNGEIKIFADGAQVFSFLDGRWHLTDAVEKYRVWEEALGNKELAHRLFSVALNLAEGRRGGLFVILDERRVIGVRDPFGFRPLVLGRLPRDSGNGADDGLWRIGDQAAVIPSFCGEGVAIALYSARLAARSFLSGASAGSFQRDLAGRLASRMRFARALSWIVSHGPALAVSSAILRVSPGSARRIATATRVPTL